MNWVDIAPTDAESVRYAAGLPMADFEDALQAPPPRLRRQTHRHEEPRGLRPVADSGGQPTEALSSLS